MHADGFGKAPKPPPGAADYFDPAAGLPARRTTQTVAVTSPGRSFALPSSAAVFVV